MPFAELRSKSALRLVLQIMHFLFCFPNFAQQAPFNPYLDHHAREAVNLFSYAVTFINETRKRPEDLSETLFRASLLTPV
jgi:hypothetical protein